MAFTPEDGNGVTGANSYLTVEDADAYWLDRANASSPDGTSWADATTEQKEGALVEASKYLDGAYSWVWANPPHWQGTLYPLSPLQAFTPLKNKDQGLQWPRNAAYDEETYVLQQGVPQKVKDATAELALIALDGSLLPVQERGGMVRRTREKVDVIEVETEYAANAPGRTTYPMLDRILRGLYSRSADGGSKRLRRA